MKKGTKILITIAIVLLILSNVFIFMKYADALHKLEFVQKTSQTQNFEISVLNFAKLFIKNVLKAEKEIDFETRLDLENSVRDLKDEEILNQWNKFVESKDEATAQVEVKNLLEILINKI